MTAPTKAAEEVDDLLALLDGVRDRARARWDAVACGQEMRRGDFRAGADACVEGDGRAGCPFAGQPVCPLQRERLEVDRHLDLLRAVRAPGAAELTIEWERGRWWRPGDDPAPCEVLAGLVPRRAPDGRLDPARALLDCPPVRLVRAFQERKPRLVDVGAREMISLRGSEWFAVLGGNVGVGKTVAACSALLDEAGGLFVDARELVRLTGDHDLLARARAASLLVLDDLGTEYDSGKGWGLSLIVDLLTFRRDHRRRTIVTTNLRRERGAAGGPDGLKERYGARLLDRLNEGAVLVGFRGASLRGSKGGPR